MSDDRYQDALRRRDDLKRQLLEVEDFLRLWKRLFGTETEQTSAEAPPAPSQRVVTLESANRRRRRSPSRERAAEIARKVITAKGLPMQRGELVKAFEAEGTPIGGDDPNKNVGTIMWRLRDRFSNIEGYGYWPTDLACPEIGYSPATQAPTPESEENG